jgi:tetratricopeptide (TPR) repeat protein
MQTTPFSRVSVTRIVGQTFALALEHHRAGRLDEAAELYREVRAIDPYHADALLLLGLIAKQRGRSGQGERTIQKAIPNLTSDARSRRESNRTHLPERLAAARSRPCASDLLSALGVDESGASGKSPQSCGPRAAARPAHG